MKFNYGFIKVLAKKAGIRITELLALAPQNDPFYVGTETDIAQAEWFADVWNKAGYVSGVHLRRVHYWCVSQHRLMMHNGEPYLNTDKCWGYLTQASKMARYLGLVRIEDIADNKNPAPHTYADYWHDNIGYQVVTPDLNDPDINLFGLHLPDIQPYHLEVWCEKSTMNDVLLPICQDYGANLVTFEGEVSITACYDLVQRIRKSKGKPCRVWYISDFDPAGNSMPVAMSRKIEYMLNYYQCDFQVKIQSLVLTIEQVKQYQLPRTPIKATEKRANSFEDAFGTGAVELDALEALYPGVLANIVKTAVSPYFSTEAADELRLNQRRLWLAIRAEIDSITANYQPEIQAVKAMIDEIKEIDIDAREYEVSTYEPHITDESEKWLFDSNRGYVEQIGYYKNHKQGIA
jgi:hypothetical protein